MNRLNLFKVVATTILIAFFQAFSIAQGPPIVNDITVCEGGSTVIVPMASDPQAFGLTILATEDFDGGGHGYTSSMQFNDSNNDHWSETDGTNISNVSGQYSFQDGTNIFFAAEDTDDNGGDGNDEQSFTLNSVTIAGYEDITFCFDVAAGNENASNYDNTDHIFVNYSIDGATMMEGLCFRSALDGDPFNSSFHHDADCDGDGIGEPQLVTTAATYCVDIPNTETDGAGNIVFEILVFLDSASEEAAYDNIEVSGTEIQVGVTFNYYDGDPANGGVLLASGNSYDPMTTPATSPQSIWVTQVEGQIESSAVEVIVTVNANPVANIAADSASAVCGITPIPIAADDAATGTTGLWSGGAGTFDSDASASTNYNPVTADLNVPTILSWTVSSVSCGDDSDEIIVFAAAEAADAEFSYLVDTICPGDGVLTPFHVTGVDGYYSVVSGDPDSLALDPMSGEIDIAASGMGEFTVQNMTTSCGNLMITGVVDGDLSGGLPKAIEFYAAADIADLSMYGFGSANNGGGTDGEELTFPAMFVPAGTFLYAASTPASFNTFFGFDADFITNAALINGDDAIELFCDGNVIDVFGNINQSGTGQPWEYRDGWAYRNNDLQINYGLFNETNWLAANGALDGATVNPDPNGMPPGFPIGTYSTTYTGVCPANTFTVDLTIGDFEMPMVICPSDLTIQLDPGDCGSFAQLVDPTAMDNCSDSIVFVYVSGPMNGDYLDKENSPYTVVYEAEEDNGNVITCSYMITIIENQNTTSTLACNGAINASLDESCEVLITADMLLEGGAYGCYEDFGVAALYDGQSVGSTIENDYGTGYSVLLDNAILNEPIEISIIELETGNSCWGWVTLEDKLAPSFDTCISMTVSCGTDITPVEPAVTENCGLFEIELDELIVPGECQDTFAMQIIRTWSVQDSEGNQGDDCVQIITVLKDTFENLVFPLNYDGGTGNLDALSCDGAGVFYAINEDGIPSPTAIGVAPGTGVPALGGDCNELVTYFEDARIDVCGNSYKILRTWTVIEWCTGAIATHTQLIKVLDEEGPEFTDPEDVVVPVTAHCHGEYFIPLLYATDNCNEASVSFASDEGLVENGFFLVDEPNLGSAYNLQAIGEDACGNQTIKNFTVTFVDLTPPVVNAETSLTITLAKDGIAKLYATSFDDGSYDACGEVGFAVLRDFNTCAPQDYFPPNGDDNFQFNEIVHFCCSDTAEPQMVTFRVCDDADNDEVFGSAGDNCNLAMVEVVVQDKTPPVITCPPFEMYNCFDAKGLDVTNTDLMDDLFGTATAENVCDGNLIQNAIYLDQGCGNGLIIRTFIATNSTGVDNCSQLITLTKDNDNELTCDRITFSDLSNNTYNWCNVNDNQNDNDDDLPSIDIDCNDGFSPEELDIDISGLCTEVGESLTIDTFNFAGGACKKYLLHYEVIDQCVFNENYVDPVTGEIDIYNSNNGYYEFFLEVNAFDNDGPIFDPADETIAAQNCEDAIVDFTTTASDACTDLEYIAFHHKIDFFGDDSIDFPPSGWANGSTIKTGTNGLGSVPIGTHTVYWYLTDGCGNSSTGSHLLIVTDNEKQPTPYCLTGLKASLSAMGMVMVEASDLDAGSFDNCTSQDDLTFSFSPDVNDTERMYTCDDLGFQFIQIYVTDEDGNQDFCNTSFLVQDNGEFCDNNKLIGSITATNGSMHKNAEVALMDIEQMMESTETDQDGIYSIETAGSSAEAELVAHDNNDLLAGITTLDIINIQKHILGLKPFVSNSQMIAADVDNSAKITGTDIIQLRRVLLGYQDYFKNNESWIFIPSSFDIEAQATPYAYPTSIVVEETNDYNWNSIKVGDVNQSYDFDFNSNIDTRSSYNIKYRVVPTENGAQKIEFLGNIEELVGLSLDLDAISQDNFFAFEAGSLAISENDYKAGSSFKLVWSEISEKESTEKPLFSLVVGNSVDTDAIADATGEAFFGTGQQTEERSVIFTREQDELNIDEMDYSFIYPNPFSESLQIDLSSFSSEDYRVSIFTTNGQAVFVQNYGPIDLISIPSTKIGAAGVYYIQIKTDTRTLSKKLIKIE